VCELRCLLESPAPSHGCVEAAAAAAAVVGRHLDATMTPLIAAMNVENVVTTRMTAAKKDEVVVVVEDQGKPTGRQWFI
jgi:hypothetical protein